METSRFKPFLLGLGICAIAIGVTSAMIALKPEAEEEEAIKTPLVVRTADADLKEQTVFASFQGEVRAKTNIELVTQVAGKVTSVSSKFVEGGEFKAGETLLQIDDADYQVALKSAEASVAAAKVDVDIELATAKSNIDQWTRLQNRPISEANPLLLNKPQIDRATARLNAAKAELSAAKLNYDRTKISAPFDGRIMSKSAELGQFLSRGSSIGRVFATDAMEVRIPMTDVQIDELGLTLGYSADAQDGNDLGATVTTLFGSEQRVWQGKVKGVDASVDSQTRLLFATIVVENPFGVIDSSALPLVPGMFVDVQLASPRKLSGLEIPRTALRNGSQVYVYQDQALRLKPVKPIYTSADRVIVSFNDQSQLAVGDRVIVSPVPGAYDGMPVKLPQEMNASAQPANVDAIDTEAERDAQQEEAGPDEIKESSQSVVPEVSGQERESLAADPQQARA